MAWPCCCLRRQTCEHCAATQWQLDVPADFWTPAGSSACESCTALNGSFLLDRTESLDFSEEGETYCVWSIEFEACFSQERDEEDEPVGDPVMHTYRYEFGLAGDGAYYVKLTDVDLGEFLLSWSWDEIAPEDCTTAEDLTLTINLVQSDYWPEGCTPNATLYNDLTVSAAA